MPLGLGDVCAGAPHASVVHAHHEALQFVLADGLPQDGGEQRPRLPRRTTEEFVVGRPFLLRVAMKTNRAGDRAFAHSAKEADPHGERALQGARLRQHFGPALQVSQERVDEFHKE